MRRSLIVSRNGCVADGGRQRSGLRIHKIKKYLHSKLCRSNWYYRILTLFRTMFLVYISLDEFNISYTTCAKRDKKKKNYRETHTRDNRRVSFCEREMSAAGLLRYRRRCCPFDTYGKSTGILFWTKKIQYATTTITTSARLRFIIISRFCVVTNAARRKTNERTSVWPSEDFYANKSCDLMHNIGRSAGHGSGSRKNIVEKNWTLSPTRVYPRWPYTHLILMRALNSDFYSDDSVPHEGVLLLLLQQ